MNLYFSYIKVLSIIVLSITTILFSSAQMVAPLARFTSIENKGSALQTSDPAIEDQPSLSVDQWQVSLENFGAVHHATSVSKETFNKLKANAEQNKLIRPDSSSTTDKSTRSAIEPPLMTRSFRGNLRNGSVPMDNSFAISRNGFIVSGINTNLIFTHPDGISRYSAALSDFFKIAGLGTRMYDPRVIYDTETDRFIIMCLHGSEPSNTALVFAFSQTEDPTGRWNIYKIDGNPLGDQYWSDYPNVSISKDDLYVSTLLRDISGDWNYSMVFQISKKDGYASKPLRWKYYADPKNADGSQAFNLVPTPNGWSELIGPGMHFISNENLGGNKYNYYTTTGNLESNPSLMSFQTTGLSTGLAPNGRQKGTVEKLNTFDSRLWSALYLNGIIHVGSHVSTPNGAVGLLYGRFDITNMRMDAEVLTLPDIDFGFPSFSSFSDTEGDDNIIINYLFSGPTIFPSQGQIVVGGKGSTFEWSDPITLKDGGSKISALEGNEERWGDYSTACRRYFDNRVETWSVGMHGESNSYATWLGQFFREKDTAKPKAEFVADITTSMRELDIKFTDITPNNPVEWQWSFPGATPATSIIKNPIVRYPTDGVYDVDLIVKTDLGVDTISKKSYIHIQDPLVKPKADFIQDNDTIFVGQTVQFSSTSTGEIVNYKWTMQGGSPPTSDVKNPSIKYNTPGSYIVALSVENIAGVNSKIKPKAVSVSIASSTKNENLDIKTSLYPNPVMANQALVTCDFEISASLKLHIRVIDSQGKEIKTLWNDRVKSGPNRLQFETTALPSGKYSIQIIDGDKTKSLPLIILK